MDSPSEMQPLHRLLTLIGRENDGIRICVAEPFTTIQSLYRASSVDEAVSAFTAEGKSVWFEINNAPIITGYRTSEADVTKISSLYVDIDFKGDEGAKQGMGSEAAAFDLIDMLSGALGVGPAAIVWTGHGIQPYWPLEGADVTEENRKDRANLLRRWGLLCAEFARAEGGAVDNVFDLARIFRAPGSTNFKNPDRPVATGYKFPEGNLPLTVEEVEEVLDAHGIRHVETAELSGEVVSAPNEWSYAERDCAHHAIVMDGLQEAPTSRHHWLLQQATLLTAMLRYGCLTKETFRGYRMEVQNKLKHMLATSGTPRPYNEFEVESAFRRAILNVQTMSTQKLENEMRAHPHPVLRLLERAEEALARGEVNVHIVNELPPVNPGKPDALPSLDAIFGSNVVPIQPKIDNRAEQIANEFLFTDAANGNRLADYVEDEYIFVPSQGWHRWENGRYVLDEENTIMEQAKASLMSFRRSNSTSDSVQKHVQKSLSLGGVRATVGSAETLPDLVVGAHRLDAKPYDLPTPGGVVDLRTGQMRPSDPRRDLNTTRALVAPSKECSTERWQAFLNFCLGGDQEMIDYMQRLVGATMIGELRYHILPILTGNGRNGKSTLLAILEKILGGYAKRMAEDFLIESHHKEHPEEIARLRGVRFAIASEAKANGRFAETRVKNLTGEKVLTGRFMGKNSFDFPNAITMWLALNHLPAVATGGKGFWARIRIIQFNGTITEEIPDLDDQLVNEEGPGILQWMIDGAVEVIKNGLQDPEGVRAQTKQYAIEEDHLGQWIADNLQVMPGVAADTEAVYTRYARFAEANRLIVLSKSVFFRELPNYIQVDQIGSTRKQLAGIALANEHLFVGPDAYKPNVRTEVHPLPPTPLAPPLIEVTDE